MACSVRQRRARTMARRAERFRQFDFQVDFGGGCEGGFQELSGLDAGPECRRVTLKRGLVDGAEAFRRWSRAGGRGRYGRRTIIIRLLDEQRRPAMAWALARAWPAKIEGPALDGTATDVAIETIELGHDGIRTLPDDSSKETSCPPSRRDRAR